jgi:hypothetical protein
VSERDGSAIALLYRHHREKGAPTVRHPLGLVPGPSARLASGRNTMHEFKIGQYVYYVPRKADGRFVVMRLLPRGTKGGPLYIVRSHDNPEREYTADASELRRVPSG